jgi:hypothetical protein
MKYRGSSHGSNEYPFLIEEQGISVLLLMSVKLDCEVSIMILRILCTLRKLLDFYDGFYTEVLSLINICEFHNGFSVKAAINMSG